MPMQIGDCTPIQNFGQRPFKTISIIENVNISFDNKFYSFMEYTFAFLFFTPMPFYKS